MGDLVEELEAEATRLSGRSIDNGCVDSGIAANLAAKAAADLARLRAENEALRAERDELDALYHEGGTWEQQLSEAEAARDAAEAKAARLETAAASVVWFDWSADNDPDAVATIDALRAALEAKP